MILILLVETHTANFTAKPPCSDVGYQNLEIPATASGVYWAFKTVTFKDVGDATAEKYFDILDVQPTKSDGSAWGTGVSPSTSVAATQLFFYKISSTGAYIDRIQWTSKGTIKGWQTWPKDGSAAKALARGDFTLKKGEGLVINYTKNVACKLRISGEVELADMSITIPAVSSGVYWMFGGNFTPVPLDIRSVQPTKSDGSAWGTGVSPSTSVAATQLFFYKISSTGAYIDRIQWTSKGTIKGWQTWPKDGSAAHALAANEWMLQPGEGYLLNYTKNVPCKLTFPNPTESK